MVNIKSVSYFTLKDTKKLIGESKMLSISTKNSLFLHFIRFNSGEMRPLGCS